MMPAYNKNKEISNLRLLGDHERADQYKTANDDHYVYLIKQQRRAKRRAIEYKGSKCTRCGEAYPPPAMEFHHRDPTQKKLHLSGRNLCRSWPAVMEELDKCDLVCANCHRIIEWELVGGE
jgi:hypothetical protein